MKDNNLLDAPHLIFNADETGMPLCSRPEQRVAVKGSKHACSSVQCRIKNTCYSFGMC